ncbi:hypothetical protein L7F22_004905 [Adiantum nelumboides]|nr:hypothetical protein [Adiantum nelumboides]
MSQTAQHEAKVKQLELELAQAKANLELQKQQTEVLSKGKEAVGSLASTSQIHQAETHLHIQQPLMPEMPEFKGTQEEEQPRPAPGALDIKEQIKQEVEDMPEGPTKKYLLYEKKVMESAALAFLQPDEQIKDFGHDFLPQPLMRHKVILWKEKMRPVVPQNEEGGYEGIPLTTEEAQTLIEDHPSYTADDQAWIPCRITIESWVLLQIMRRKRRQHNDFVEAFKGQVKEFKVCAQSKRVKEVLIQHAYQHADLRLQKSPPSFPRHRPNYIYPSNRTDWQLVESIVVIFDAFHGFIEQLHDAFPRDTPTVPPYPHSDPPHEVPLGPPLMLPRSFTTDTTREWLLSTRESILEDADRKMEEMRILRQRLSILQDSIELHARRPEDLQGLLAGGFVDAMFDWLQEIRYELLELASKYEIQKEWLELALNFANKIQKEIDWL